MMKKKVNGLTVLTLLTMLMWAGCSTTPPPRTHGDSNLAHMLVDSLLPEELGRHTASITYGDWNSFDYLENPDDGTLHFYLTVESPSIRARMWMDAHVGAYHDFRRDVIRSHADKMRELIKDAPPHEGPPGVAEDEIENILDDLFPESTMIIDGTLYHVARYETGDGYTEELVQLPEGATLAEYGPMQFRARPEVESERGAFSWLSLTPGFLVLNIEFGEFRDLLPAPRYYEPVIAQNGETELRPVKQPGILARTAEVVRENPGKSLTAGVLAADLLYDGKVNLFGLVGNDDGGGGTNISVGGDATIVVGDQHTDTRDQSNRPQTAQPHFPPAE